MQQTQETQGPWLRDEQAHDAQDKQDELFKFGQFSIDQWLRKVPGGYLKGTRFGHATEAPIPEEIQQDELLQQIYLLDLALFIGAERAGAQAAAGLARLAPDEESMIFLASQTLDEARHFESFAARFRDMGLPDAVRDKLAEDFMPPAYKEFLDLLLESVDAGDFEAGIVGLNVILEGMAFPLYEYEIRYWTPFDPAFAQVIRNAFLDECRHVGFGEKRIAHTLKHDPSAKRRVQRKVNAFSIKMNEAFDQFLTTAVDLYDMAVRNYPERCAQVEIVPGKTLANTETGDQVRWLKQEIGKVHGKRIRRLGLELEV